MSVVFATHQPSDLSVTGDASAYFNEQKILAEVGPTTRPVHHFVAERFKEVRPEEFPRVLFP